MLVSYSLVSSCPCSFGLVVTFDCSFGFVATCFHCRFEDFLIGRQTVSHESEVEMATRANKNFTAQVRRLSEGGLEFRARRLALGPSLGVPPGLPHGVPQGANH